MFKLCDCSLWLSLINKGKEFMFVTFPYACADFYQNTLLNRARDVLRDDISRLRNHVQAQIMHQKVCPNNVGGYISAETEGQSKGLNSS